MKPLHFRIRTYMVVIAVLALLMTISPRQIRIERVTPGKFKEAETVLTVGCELRTRVDQTFNSDGVLREEVYLFMPVECLIIPILMLAGSVAIVLCSPTRREGRSLAVAWSRIHAGQQSASIKSHYSE